MTYWDETDNYLRNHAGKGPACPNCGQEMFPEDDHGRFMCFCSRETFDARLESFLAAPDIPQVDVSGMTNEEKAQVPPLHRLHQPMTEAEAKLFELLARGPEVMNDPEYWAASEALDKERKQASEE